MFKSDSVSEAIAIRKLVPDANFTLYGRTIEYTQELDDDGNPTGNIITPNFIWEETNTEPKPTKSQIDEVVEQLEAEWLATEYQRQRQPEYPHLADLADALYWQAKGDETKMTAYLAAVEAVKQKYPKGV